MNSEDNDMECKKGSILLVEDEDLLRWSMKTYLEARGYEVEDTQDVRKALKILSADSYDVIVTDLMVKNMSGLDLTAYVRQNCPDSQVIIITGRGSKETAIEALRQGVFDYIEKPFDLELLLINIEKALEKLRLMKELVRLSRTDGLTGLYNQRYFYNCLQREINRARRQEHDLSLILADVDCFKEFNDRHGHLEGDEALVKLAGCLREACRQDVDMVFRYGGDEFIIILPEADIKVAEDVSSRIREISSRLDLDNITLSMGLAQLNPSHDVKTFIRHADEAMYLAKQMGGDRLIVFSQD